MIFENKNNQLVTRDLMNLWTREQVCSLGFNPATIQIFDLKEVIYIYDI